MKRPYKEFTAFNYTIQLFDFRFSKSEIGLATDNSTSLSFPINR